MKRWSAVKAQTIRQCLAKYKLQACFMSETDAEPGATLHQAAMQGTYVHMQHDMMSDEMIPNGGVGAVVATDNSSWLWDRKDKFSSHGLITYKATHEQSQTVVWLAGIYLRPHNSVHRARNGTVWQMVEQLIAHTQDSRQDLIVMGDFNARIASKSVSHSLLHRRGEDKCINQHGKRLLRLCEDTRGEVLTGTCVDAPFTCYPFTNRGSSTVDHMVWSRSQMQWQMHTEKYLHDDARIAGSDHSIVLCFFTAFTTQQDCLTRQAKRVQRPAANAPAVPKPRSVSYTHLTLPTTPYV